MTTTNDTLALRYRPRKLSEVAGQSAVKRILEGVFKGDRIPNAFMFTGTSGIGKTTLARLIARYLNCDKRSACGKCESCEEMNSSHPDYVEVNASEAGNIETVRSLISDARFLPRHRIRIYMLDEIHRASHAAIQALLVPVETPPSKTLWIFATTDPDKIPNGKALMGRCQILNLNPPTKSEVAERLLAVGKKEGMDWLTQETAESCAESSNGQVRNALQILERTALAVSALDKKPKRKEIASLMEESWIESTTDDLDGTAFSLLKGIYEKNAKAVAKACLDASDPVSLLGRAVVVNSNALGLSLLGKHEKLWRSKPVVALSNVLGDMPKKSVRKERIAVVTLELIATRDGLFSTSGQQYPAQYAMSRLLSLCSDDGG